MADSWRDGIWLKLLNVVVYFLFLGSNISTIFVPHNPYDNGKQTYITPSPWAYLIWSLIHLLLLGTIFYQFTPEGKKVIIDGISWRFALLGVLNAIYVNLWSWDHYFPARLGAFIVALFVSSSVTHIYYIIKKFHSPSSYFDELFVHLPFSLWHGWTTILVTLAACEAFGTDTSNPPSWWTKVFVYLALFFFCSTAEVYAVSTPKGDLPAAIVITWSLFAIFDHQRGGDPNIYWSALGFALLSLLSVYQCAFALFSTWYRGGIVLEDDEERAPLTS